MRPTIAWSFLFIYGGLAALYLVQIIILSKIHKTSTVGQVSQNNCGIDAIEQDTYRYQLAKALEGYAPGYKGLGTFVTIHNMISFTILAWISIMLVRAKLMHGGWLSDFQVFVVLSAVFMPFYMRYFWTYAPQVESDEVKTYRTQLKAVTEVLDALKKADLLNQEKVQQTNATTESAAQKAPFSIDMYLLQIRIIERIMTVDQKRSRTDAIDAFRNMSGADIIRYINFDVDKDYPWLKNLVDLRDGSNNILTESLSSANCTKSKDSPVLFIFTGCDGTASAPSNAAKYASISFDQATAFRSALESLKSTDFKVLAKAQSDGYTTWVRFLYFTGIFFGCWAIHFLLKVVSMVTITVTAVIFMSIFVLYYTNFG